MDDALVERVARAMCNSQGSTRNWWADASPDGRDDFRAMAKAAIAACFEWQPIETAPRDETRVLAFWKNPAPEGRSCYAIAAYIGRCWMDDENEQEWASPTHWLPLPPPPVTP